MSVDISNTPSLRLNPTQELKFTKPATELYIGQILKAVVVKTLSESQVLININGENINAQTSQHLNPGDMLQIKVLNTHEEPIVLQILKNSTPLTFIEAALAKTLPMQAPATQFLSSLVTLTHATNLPLAINQQIKQLLASITSLSQLPQQLAQAIACSGLFLESALLNQRRKNTNIHLQNDFKGQCLRLLAALSNEKVQKTSTLASFIEKESLYLPGAGLIPLHQAPLKSFSGQPIASVLALLREQTEQVLARIKTNQLTHLMQASEEAYSLSLELALSTATGIELISLAIKEEQQNEISFGKSWSINFAIHLAKLGTIQAKLTLRGQAVEVQINTEKQETISLLTKNQPIFDSLMTQLGLNLRLWNLRLGLEEQADNSIELHLLDIRI